MPARGSGEVCGERVLFFFFPVVVKFFLWFFLLLFYFGFWGGWSLCPVRKGEPQCLVLQSHATKPHCMGSEQY